MVNQVMSLELAVGLAHETKRNITVHYMVNNGDSLYQNKKVPVYTPSRWYNNQRASFINQDHFPHILDLLDIPDVGISFIDEKVEAFPLETHILDPMAYRYYYSSSSEMSDDEHEFAEGRERLDLSGVPHLKGTLGWYSRFFYNRSKELDLVLSQVKFKKEYQDLADQICSAIGPFIGMHLRLSDHIKMFNTTQDMFESRLSQVEGSPLPIVVSTCEPGNPMVVKNRKRFILLDEYIIANFSKQFKELPYQDEVTFGLICCLVMCRASEFIGTSGSTYTGYIQRLRNQYNLVEDWKFFDIDSSQTNTKYSWNDYDLTVDRKMWWREWRESKLEIT